MFSTFTSMVFYPSMLPKIILCFGLITLSLVRATDDQNRSPNLHVTSSSSFSELHQEPLIDWSTVQEVPSASTTSKKVKSGFYSLHAPDELYALCVSSSVRILSSHPLYLFLFLFFSSCPFKPVHLSWLVSFSVYTVYGLWKWSSAFLYVFLSCVYCAELQ